MHLAYGSVKIFKFIEANCSEIEKCRTFFNRCCLSTSQAPYVLESTCKECGGTEEAEWHLEPDIVLCSC